MQVVLNHGLAGVLAAATEDNVDVLGEGLAGVVVQNLHVEAVCLRAAGQRQGVAPVAVDVHIQRVELHDAQRLAVVRAGRRGALKSVGCRHYETFSTSVIFASSSRRASMAV